MQDYELNGINASRAGAPYASQQELMEDMAAALDYRLFVFYSHHQWLGPDNEMRNMLGLMVTREEFEHSLSGDGVGTVEELAEEEERAALKLGTEVLTRRLQRTAADAFPAMSLIQRFELDLFQWQCVCLVYASQTDDRYEKMCAYLQDDITKKHPSPLLCARLFTPEGYRPEQLVGQFTGSVFASLFDPESSEQLKLRREVLDFLGGREPQVRYGMQLFRGEVDEPMLTRFETARTLDNAMNTGGKRAILLSGPAGCGKCFQIRHLCSRQEADCLFADMEALGYTAEAVEQAAFLSRLWGSYLCLYHLDPEETEGAAIPQTVGMLEAIHHIEVPQDALFLLSCRVIHPRLDLLPVDVVMEPSTEAQRAELFAACLGKMDIAEDVDAYEMASKFCFELKQIVNACRQAAGVAKINGRQVDAELLHKCCYRQITSKLDSLASRIRPNFTWDDVVMPVQQKKLLQHACSYVKYRHQVYQEWGFDRRISYGRGLSILFAGVPGTGKTMCAQVMAKHLNMEMYKINISQIVSKYIGETEKNLQAVFTEAKKANCILFFDECDALFGKRSEVKDAHDRNANVEVAYLLQQIEEYDGVCVLDTNLLQNIDEAFMRRITYVVRFPFPDAPARREIYLRTIPAQTPLDEDIDWDFIAEKFELSGGHIKNIVLSAAFAAAAEGTPITMRHMLNAAVGEMKKNDIVVVREELREYADLLD